MRLICAAVLFGALALSGAWAFPGSITMLMGASAVAVAPSSSLWSLTQKAASLTLDATSRIATQGSTANAHSAIYTANSAPAPAKKYFEVDVGTTSAANVTIGVGNPSAATVGDQYVGIDANSASWIGYSGMANITGITAPTISSGDQICVAFDTTGSNNLIWFTKMASVAWNFGAAGANFPSSGTGGGTFTINAGAIVGGYSTAATGDTATLQAIPCNGVPGLTGFSPL